METSAASEGDEYSGRCMRWCSQDLSFLPGSENEKMSPWGQAVFDTSMQITTSEVVDELIDRDMIEGSAARNIHAVVARRTADRRQRSRWNQRLVDRAFASAGTRGLSSLMTLGNATTFKSAGNDGVVAVVEKLKGGTRCSFT